MMPSAGCCPTPGRHVHACALCACTCWQHMLVLACAVILVLAGCLCSVSTRGAKWSFLISGAFLLLGGIGASIALLVVAPTLQPASWAVRHYDADNVDSSNLPSLAYMYLLGMLMGQATFIGRPLY